MNTTVSNPGTKGRFWFLMPVALLTAMFVGWGTMISIALDDPGFGVEPDYYDKAVHFDAHQAQMRESRRLGWTLELETKAVAANAVALSVVMRDRGAAPIDDGHLVVTAFHNARSSELFELSLSGEGQGRYVGRLASMRPGLWEFRFRFDRGSDRFVHVVRRDVAAEGLP